ncbi:MULTISPECIES: polysaccharide deacetylase family protein [Clostridium]|uniref:Polysaccharide deacetylase n=1 Tax=Clostridium botulinum TaxID=1491 RepID=A0A6B4HTV6_CLOBO|nr:MULTISPECIES: polysaccharide deacetylase family protein [Clostridium]ACD51771.1 polysaccharide deacetylase domain protein [Clostridium botulinum E3 str. Alaska E43]AJF28752.1 polysaccharide deacetylase [Clostridium botulinum]AJF31813.1 polysaccharide deacetylase [Clostridium botulinum]KIL08968.1 polysaccharide deacetylase [Clostridium botulinum]MBN1034574.1 polysaccharide deacetylase [Clostridium botulinum]
MKFNKFNKLFIILLTLILITNLSSNVVYADDESKTNKTIYLTFDDGPAGKVTEDVLAILKKEQIHATFFLIGDQIKGQEDLVKTIYNEGHSLGLHSMTHKKNNLYSSNEHFLKEMLETQELINSIIGVKPVILRFPFGCNNNSYKLCKSMVDLLHQNNLKIYDWNVDSGDGANHSAAPSTFIKNARSNNDTVILLMHCGYISKNSVKALPEVIKYYKNNGYEFKAITNDTPEEYRITK